MFFILSNSRRNRLQYINDLQQLHFEFDLQKGDLIYTLTDGMPDQFGGLKGKKFMYKQLKQLLISITHESMENQRQFLVVALNAWKGNLEQVDDITLIGIRI